MPPDEQDHGFGSTAFGAVRRVNAAPTHQPEQSGALSWGQRRFLLVLGLPAFGVALAYTVVSTYLPVLLGRLSRADGHGHPAGRRGPDRAGTADPGRRLVGRLRTRIGGRLPFILAGAAFTIPALVLMPLFAGSLAGVAVTLALFLIGYFVYLAPYYALYPDLGTR